MESNKFIFFTITLFFSFGVCAQNSAFLKKSDTLNTKRRNAVIVIESASAVGTLLALNELWYKDYPRSGFHLKNDNNDWKQMDKAGHLMTSYYLGKIGMEILDWTGVSKKSQLIYGATAGFVSLASMEVLDGFSDGWGASPGDILANAAGTSLLIGQELLWDEQRINVKYSFHQTHFAKQRPNILGDGFGEEFLKDYNGQTYWLSANIWSFHKNSSFPKWLNLALGYGAEGMLYGETKPTNAILQDPYRQYYLSFDFDLTKIETKSKFLKSLFSAVNFIKIPSPTLEINSRGKIKFHYIYF